ncbi:microcin ABC transporter ATP-binding protein [Marinicaulis flavus]|uniref:Microcin ABC transporter ATP-binding protein n=1 Tax=Hyphococcus luteus TaxID=2058213 RepID=A0A2S7K3A0_9PROT|nr:microcin ABC transporter ATP-binding protein [Marinicaulis flavus]
MAIRNLSLRIGGANILDSVNLRLNAGEITGLIGRSGSGKSMTALAMMGLAPGAAEISGEIIIDGENVLAMRERARCDLRGRKIAMVFQEPMTALNPLQTIGAQVAETFLAHEKISRAEAFGKSKTALGRAGLPPEEISPERRPHELSGGQRQRAGIAIAIAMKPGVLIADEPTTALDVTTQAEILGLLKTLAKEDGSALLLITHDLAVVSSVADRIAVLKEGRIVADESADDFYSAAPTSLAREFMPARVKRDGARPASPKTALAADNLSCDYVNARRSVFVEPAVFRAVKNVSFKIAKGETLGLVGESGCGKSTLARALLGLHPIAEGTAAIGGEIFPAKDKAAMRRLRRKIQIVFQDPYSSFNPRQRIADILAEPFHLFDEPMTAAQKRERAAALMESVGLGADALDKYPHAFSGGQRQRIAIARALATDPEVIVLDEATSALDIASRNHILELLQSLQAARGLSLLFITHDLSVIRDIADRVMVMNEGRILESGETDRIFESPQTDYTRRLIAAAPVIEWRESAGDMNG